MMNLNILVCDDEEEIRDILETILSHMGHQVTKAKDGKEALNLVGKNKFDLIFLDNYMPIMTGEDFLNEISKNKPSDLKIIFTTGQSSNLLDLVEANNVYHCVDSILNKPFTTTKLKEAIEELF